MIRVYIADAQPDERSALRLLLLDLKDPKVEVVGEAAGWRPTLVQAPSSRLNMLLVDSDILPEQPEKALKELREACPNDIVIVLISHLNARQQAARSTGADTFISKEELPHRLADRLRVVSESVHTR